MKKESHIRPNEKFKSQRVPEKNEGEKFLEKLRKMPYTNDRVGKAFVIIRWREIQKSRKTDENSSKSL